jgi:predicted MFS family arabinose efflux permease
VVPRGLKGVPLSLATWLQVARHPTLFIILAVTVVSSSGQFGVWAYVAPYTAALFAPSKELFSGLLMWFGAFGLVGNVLATRAIATRGPAFNVNLALLSMAFGLLILMFMGASVLGYMLGGVFWGLGVFASNSSQQARLAAASPQLSGASIALNTSMMYLGQAVGTTFGGATISAVGYAWLPLPAVLLLLVALALSIYAQRISRPSTAAAPS